MNTNKSNAFFVILSADADDRHSGSSRHFFYLAGEFMPQRSKRVIVSVISDLVTDQRVHRSALTLHKMGYDVELVGRRMKHSLPLENRPYRTRRFRLWFEKGPMFYACYNVRLFFYLLGCRADVYLSNDLDTLAANFLVSRIKNVKLVYDSHEYFTEVPELACRPLVQRVWKWIERLIFPRLKHVFTVNESIALLYSSKYKVTVRVIRNLPFKSVARTANASRADWGLPADKKVFLFQGAGINIDRGAEEAMEAIQLVEGAVLLFIGAGDVIEKVKSEAGEKIFFIPKQPFGKLQSFTAMADFGLTLDKDTNMNYRYSLPNKLFDYIQAGLPVLATALPEVKKIIDRYDIGLTTVSSEPGVLAEKMRAMMNEAEIAKWKKNLAVAAEELCWEEEQKMFMEIFKDVESA